MRADHIVWAVFIIGICRICEAVSTIECSAQNGRAIEGMSGSDDKFDRGVIKETMGMDLLFFSQQLELIKSRRASWLDKAAAAIPELRSVVKKPVAVISVERDASSFQGCRAIWNGSVTSVCNRPLQPGDSFILDFGEHLTGHFIFALCRFNIPVDAPVRLKFVFGETLAEVAQPLDPYFGTLARSWLQDETVNIDEVPQTVRLSRRYAFRYVQVTVASCSKHGTFGFSDLQAEAATSADEGRLLPFTPANAEEAALDRVSLRTLRDCMQTVFEDGPKRDRRLWLGDLRLQALVNYATYCDYNLVKRSLYLLAGTATDEGLVSTCSFENPQPARGGNSILDYTALFASTVLEYFEASGDRETADDLWPLVIKQLEFTLKSLDKEGLFVPSTDWWLFIDWNRTLDKQASEQAIILTGLKDTQKLAEKLGRQNDVLFIPKIVSRMETAAQKFLWDESIGMFVSGPERQVSWASQAWMVLAGIPSHEQGRRALINVINDPSATKPVTPYMYHYMVEALLISGLKDEAAILLHNYWGGMIRKGADTFWEVYIPDDDYASPYQNYLMNSYCHAWSCTPAYLLRVFFVDKAEK
jgi:alpha-L-rhamnosidase